MARVFPRWIDSTGVPAGAALLADGQGRAAYGEIVVSDAFRFTVGGVLSAAVGLSGLGPEIAATAGTITELRGRRGAAGTTGTTIIELEINGAATGRQLSWATSDGAHALKSLTGFSAAYAEGDRLSLKMVSAETAAEDIAVEAS